MDSLKFVSAAAEAAPKMEDEEGLMWRPSKSDTEGHQLEIIRRHAQCLKRGLLKFQGKAISRRF